jgi:hypothetical protein
MSTSRERTKSIIEAISMIVIFTIFGLALGEVIAQSILKLVMTFSITLVWLACFLYGYKFKESFFLKRGFNSHKVGYIIEQALFLTLIGLSVFVFLEAMYT